MRKSALFVVMAFWATFVLAPRFALAADGTWNADAPGGDWSSAPNWVGNTIADGVGATANLTDNITGATTVTIDGATASRTLGVLNIGDTNTSHAYLLNASGSGTLTFANAGTAQLNQVATSAGDTISAPLLLNSSLNIGNASSNALTVSGTITANAAGTKTIANNSSSTGGVVLSGVIADGGGGTVAVTQNSATSTLMLSGANTYTGLTNVQAGELDMNTTGSNSIAGNLTVSGGTAKLLQANQIADTQSVSVSSGTLNLQGFNETVAGVQLSGGNITGAGGSLTSTSAFDLQSGNVSAILGGTAGATKTGIGTVTYTGANNYTGSTDVQAGELDLNTTGANSIEGNLTVSGGTVKLLRGNQIDDTKSVSVSAGTFNIQGFNETVAGLQLTGGSITGTGILTSTSALDLQSGNVSAVLAGSVGATKTGAGTVTYSGANTYTGATNINGGTLRLGASEVISDASAVSIASGAALDLNGNTETIASLTGAGTVMNGGGAATLKAGGDGTSMLFSGVIQDAVGLTKEGLGTLILSGANTYSGATNINGGTIQISAANNLGNGSLTNTIGINGGKLESTSGTYALAANQAITLGGAGTIQDDAGTLTVNGSVTNGGNLLTVAGAGNTTLNGPVGGTGGLTKADAGTLALNGNNTYSGATNINGGTVQISAANNLGNGSVTNRIGINGGILESTSGTYALAANQAITLGGGGTIQDDTGTLTVNGAVTNGGNLLTVAGAGNTTLNGAVGGIGGLTKTDAGTLMLSGNIANTYSGMTNVNLGTLALNKTAGTNAVAGDLTVAGGTLTWLANNQVADTSSISMTSGAVDLNGKTETITAFSNSGGTFTTGAGHLIGTGNTVSWSGGTNTINHDGIVEDKHIVITGGVNTVEGQGDGATGGVLKVNSGGVGLEMTGATLTLDSDDYAAGKLLLNGDVTTHASGTSSVIANAVGGINAGTVDLGVGTRTFTVANGQLLGAVDDLVISATITNGALTKTGAGVLVLSGANTYTGATTINNGTIKLGASGVIADASAVVLGATGILNVNGYNETIGSLAGAGLVRNGGGSATLSAGADNTSTLFSGVIQDAVGLTKVGNGTLTLSGANSYTGATNINGGTLQISAGNNLGDSSQTTNTIGINGGILESTSGTYALGTNRTITLGGAGTIKTDAGTLTVDGAVANGGNVLTVAGAGNTIVSGAVSGTGGLTKIDGGTLTLSSTLNAYSGATTVSVGKLILGAAGVITDTSAVSVASGATLDLNGNSETIGSLLGGGTVTSGTSATLTAGGDNTSAIFFGIIQNSVGLTKEGSGTFTLSGGNSYIGLTTINAGTLVVAANQALGTNALGTTVSNGATLGIQGNTTYSTPEALTLNGAGAGGVGALNNISGINSFAGPVTLATASTIGSTAGTLTLGGTVDNGANVLTVAGAGNTIVSGAVSGAGGLIKNEAGTLTLSGANAYRGGTILNAGTLSINNATALGAAAGAFTINGGSIDSTLAGITVGNNAQNWNGDFAFKGTQSLDLGTGAVALGADRTVTVNANTLTVGGVISGAYGLTKAGAGALTLNGINTYTGPTSISAGTLTLNQSLATVLIYTASGTVVNVAGTKSLNGAVTTTADGQGTLNFLGQTTTGANIGDVSGNGLLAVNFNGPTTLANDIAATTTTIKAGSTVTLSGNRATGALIKGDLTLQPSASAVLDLGANKLTMLGSGVYTQNNGSTLKTTLSTLSSYGQIVSSGPATVGASAVVVVTNNITEYLPDALAFKIIDGTGGSGVSVANAAHWVLPSTIFWSLVPTGGEDLTLTVNRNKGYNFFATDNNTKAVGTALEAAGKSGASGDMLTVLTALDNASSPSEVQGALKTMEPILDGATQQIQEGMLDDFLSTAQDRITRIALEQSSGYVEPETGISTGDDFFGEEVMWGRVIGSRQHADSRSLSNGYDAHTYGTIVGGDQQIPGRPFRVGTALGYAIGQVDSKDNAGRNTIDSYQGSVYGSYQEDNSPFFMDGFLGFSYNVYRLSRRISGVGLDRMATAQYNGEQYSAMVDSGYIIKLNEFNLTPMASLQFSRLMMPGYQETGADALNLTVTAQDYNLLESGLGFRIDRTFDSAAGKWTPEIRAKWFYDWISDRQAMTSTFEGGGGAFKTEGFDPARNGLDLGTKLTLLTKENVSISLNYDLLLKQNYYSHSGFAELGLKW